MDELKETDATLVELRNEVRRLGDNMECQQRSMRRLVIFGVVCACLGLFGLFSLVLLLTAYIPIHY